jgi:hypothetical protein
MHYVLNAAGPGASRRDVGIKADSRTLLVSVVSRDRPKAQAAARVVINALMKASLESARRTDVLDPASFPTALIFPNHLVIAALGLAIGLAIGMTLQWRTRALA